MLDSVMPFTGTHHVFANSEVQIASGVAAGLEVARAFEFQRRFVRGGEVRRSSDEPRNVLRKRVQHFSGTLAGSYALRISREAGDVLIPAWREFMALHMAQALGQLRELLGVIRVGLRPLRSQFTTTLANRVAEMLAHSVRNQELGVFRPTVKFFDQSYFFLSKRLAVGGIRILLVGRSVTDVAVENDQGGTIRRFLERFKSSGDHLQIVGIAYARHIRLVANEARG